MTRIFYSDYGEDPVRLAKIEALLKDLKAGGAEVCRTSRRPLDTVALNLVLPNLIERSMKGAGVTLHPGIDPNERVLRIQAAAFQYDHPRKSARDCYTSMLMYRQYIEQELDRFRPDLVILWHQFNAYHYAIADWCSRKGVPVLFGENGVLPGSWCFEFQGQMGESWISRAPEAFKALPAGAAETAAAEAYLQHAVAHRLNRKSGGISAAEAGLAAPLAADPRPKILYAGINDFKTGLQPYTRRRTLLHTGDFISSEAGLQALLPLARKNGWHILYKAHPSLKHTAKGLEDYSDCLTEVDKRADLVSLLQHTDALATIVSQSAYMALMHDTPVVLMGRIQLSGSGLAHEAPYRAGLEQALRAALADRDSAARRRLLLDHIARLLKYYVISSEYDDKGLFNYSLSDFSHSLLAMAAAPGGQSAQSA
ncbi:hypothetical protein [Cribrihabitans pelagius]|uniref:capsular polysaccharide export protein, LipB/KpsS family n=1 Tax=Cribrihabitans pelagius TaxID=1765746 RepID=UPI003B5C6843